MFVIYLLTETTSLLESFHTLQSIWINVQEWECRRDRLCGLLFQWPFLHAYKFQEAVQGDLEQSMHGKNPWKALDQIIKGEGSRISGPVDRWQGSRESPKPD